MYSQIQYYQQHHGGTAVSTHQSGLRWNGSRWVGAAPTSGFASNVGSGTFSTYQQQNGQNHRNIAPAGDVAGVNLVQKYTKYYHEWTAKAEEKRRMLPQFPEGSPERVEAQTFVDWAKYYADQSSRAAYHFHGNPTATTAPFDLPPDPDTVETAAPAASSSQQTYQSMSSSRQSNFSSATTTQPYSAYQQQPKSSSSSSPDSLKRYVDRCLSQCRTANEKEAMTKEVEKLIQSSLQKGTLHSQDWDSAPLLTVPVSDPQPPRSKKPRVEAPSSSFESEKQSKVSGGASASPGSYVSLDTRNNHQQGIASGSSSGQHDFTDFTNYYGSAGSHNNHSKRSRDDRRVHGHDDKLPVNDSYYGPSVSSSLSSNTHHSSQQQHSLAEETSKRLTSRVSFQQQRSLERKASHCSSSSSESPPLGGGHGHRGSPSSSQSPRRAKALVAVDAGGAKRRRSKKSPSPDPFENGKSFVAIPQGKKQNSKPEGKKSGFKGDRASMETRAKRFAGAGGISASNGVSKAVQGVDRYMGKGLIGGKQVKLDSSDYESMTVKGTCTVLEKQYLRLTAPPRAELVRPEAVLGQHLTNLKSEWKSKERRDYLWFCSQLKAVRQDCTVQRIQNAFTVDVYETHARIALQEGDMNEYNQCQTQLKELYLKLKDVVSAIQNRNEFVAYRLLYYIFLTGNKKYDGGSSDLFKIMLSLSKEQRSDPAIKHALSVRVAVADTDYHSFFGLQKKCPGLGCHLMDKMIPMVRYHALQRMCRAYRPTVNVDFVLGELGFDAGKESDRKFGRIYLVSCGCVLTEDETEWKTKDSVVHESDMEEKKSLI